MQERSSCWCSFCHWRWVVAKVTPVRRRSPAYRMLLVPLWCLPKWPSKSQSRPGIRATHTRKHTGTEDNPTVRCVVDSSVCSLSELIAVSAIKTSLFPTFRLLRISVSVFSCSPNVSETCHPFPSQIIMLFLLKAHNQFLKQDLRCAVDLHFFSSVCFVLLFWFRWWFWPQTEIFCGRFQ